MDTPFTKAVDEVIKLKLEIVDDYLKEMAEPLKRVGNPEELINKKYENWTPQDLELLKQVYPGEDTPLTRLIFKKSYEEVLKLEQEA